MPPPSEGLRHGARGKLLALLQTAPCFTDAPASSSSTVDLYAREMEVALFDKFTSDADSYRNHLFMLLANLPNVLPSLDVTATTAANLATSSETDLLSAAQRSKRDRESRKRLREATLIPDDSVMCHKCSLPIRSRININRFDIDDEALGTQYDNNFGTYCECRAAKRDDDAESGSSSSSHSGENDDNNKRGGKHQNAEDDEGNKKKPPISFVGLSTLGH